MERIERNDLTDLFRALRATFADRRDALVALDGHVGDSDLGITMNKGFSAACDAVEAAKAEGLGKSLQLAGMAFAKAAPSTMGTLTAGGIMRAGKALIGRDALGAPEMLTFWTACRDGIAERGKAKPGDKTILDVLFPIVDSLQQSADEGRPLAEALDRAAAAAAAGLEATRTMVAQHGKAACFQEKSLGLEDAGATVGVLMIETMRDFVGGARTASA